MNTTTTGPHLTPILGDEVAKEVLRWIGAFRQLTKATIISFNMQDYDFWGNGRLSNLLRRQLAHGAAIDVMTTPPPGTTGGGIAFKNKLALLEDLQHNGAAIYLHRQIHAKAYLFADSENSTMLIVGSPNLTSTAFSGHATHSDNLLELALLTGDTRAYDATLRFIETNLFLDPATVDFATWSRQNISAVAQARGGS